MTKAVLCGGVLAFALAACGIFGSDDDDGAPAAPSQDSADGGSEGGPVVSGSGEQPTFTLGVSADALPLTQGGKAKLVVSVSRSAEAVASNLPITVTAKLPAKITGAPLIIQPTALTGEMELSAEGDAEQGDAAIELSATSGTASAQATAKLLVRGTPGKMDTTFGTTGTAHIPQASLASGAMLVQTDQKIIAIGTSNATTTVVVRLLPSGEVDSSFGGGKITFPGLGKAWGATLQPDGKILIVGRPTTTSLTVARLMPDGTFDTTFGTSGIATINLPSGTTTGYFQQVAVAPDGTIVVGFNWTQTNNDLYWAVAHLTDKGALVTTTGGLAKGRWTTTNDGISGVGVRADTGKIFGVGGNGGGLGFGIFQLTPDHAPDPTFGSPSTPGLSFVSRPQYVVGGTQQLMEELPDHSVMAEFIGNNVFDVVRFRADGNGIDTTFGTDGFVTLPGIPQGMCVGAGGTIVAAAMLDFNATSWGLTRLLPNGAVDPSFADGKTIVQTGARVRASAVASQADGRILVLGFSGTDPNTEFFVQRFWN